ncbi:hypothetical protein [Mesorhizobium onobrychidis]|uniref:Uncharacterized protein n=1 Tax=Mesorhizobium onobrychidis TaxID=2775404 RepID=A0ABY5QTK8_9HYPH|nr:hypothetical protein [Mesorhizobium onobrychidis]UVC14383.1 hypothetical protein IHQ72_27635 [Mesorhizobium onobrychidis]
MPDVRSSRTPIATNSFRHLAIKYRLRRGISVHLVLLPVLAAYATLEHATSGQWVGLKLDQPTKTGDLVDLPKLIATHHNRIIAVACVAKRW